MTSLAERSAQFAAEIQTTLDSVLPGQRTIVSRRTQDRDRYIVQPAGDRPADRRIAVMVNGEHLADLSLSLYLDLDKSGQYLKTVRSDLAVHSVLDRTPLVRLEYRSDMHTVPIAHWQVHAERGSFSHLLARAHAHRPELVPKPHDLSSLHIPVGGERFRPCMEDMLQFLITECGVDAVPGWEAAVAAGRSAWRLRQVGTVVRDLQVEAAGILSDLGWSVQPPTSGVSAPGTATLTSW